MKIPLIMRKQYQGQLSASMLYILLCRTGFMAGSFLYTKNYVFQKNKKHRNFLFFPLWRTVRRMHSHISTSCDYILYRFKRFVNT